MLPPVLSGRGRWLVNVALLVVTLLVAYGAFRVVTKDRTVRVAQPGHVATHAPGKVVRAIFFGDSIVAGAATGVGNPTFVDVTSRLLGWQSSSFGYPGSGFTTAGVFRGGRDYLARSAQFKGYDVDVVVVEGGLNDGHTDAALLTSKAKQVLANIRLLLPRAQLVLMGPWSFRGEAIPTVIKTRDTLRDLAQSQGLPFVDPVGENWITGTYPTSGNAAKYISSDGYYPNTEGHAYFGQRLAQDLRKLLPTRLLP